MLYCAVRAVADTSIDIPNRAAFKASEVCEIAQIPPYVLRSWEKEFPGLGAAARPGGPRIYRRSDIEQILRIKQLVFAEGLTLAGARRRLEGDPASEEVLEAPATVSDQMKAHVAEARRGLKDLLTLLSAPSGPGRAEAAAGVAPAAPAGGTAADEEEVEPTWPPSAPRGRLADEGQGDLLLLGDAPEGATKPRRARKPATRPRTDEPSKVK